MITRFHIENFKSLVNFDLPADDKEMPAFTCLIGLNGAGKSTLLQAFDFVAQVASGGIADWLGQREWKKNELVSHLGGKKPTISFNISINAANGTPIRWEARFNYIQLRCNSEAIHLGDKQLLKLDDGRLSVAGAGSAPEQKYDKIPFEYQGSVISTLKLTDAHPAIGELKTALQSLKSLELLSPHAMRRRAKTAEDIGAGGEKLSAFLSTFTTDQKAGLLTEIRNFYPMFTNLHINTLRYGWKNLRVWESYASNQGIDATHLNDGLLRIIAILAQAQSSHTFLLFDEIENGINPALVQKLMDFLVELGQKRKQVIVTTHSPVILNYLDDEVAKAGVMLLYKTADGQTKSCRYFDQPETSHKLKALGPGEVFIDTDLTKMVDRLSKGIVNAEHSEGVSR